MGTTPIFFATVVKPDADLLKFSFPSALKTLIHKTSFFELQNSGKYSRIVLVGSIFTRDFCTQGVEAFINPVIAPVDLLDIVYHAFTLSGESSDEQGNPCTDIG